MIDILITNERKDLKEITYIAESIIQCIESIRSNVGRTKIASILTGSKSSDIVKKELDKTPFHNHLKGVNRTYIAEIIDAMIRYELIDKSNGFYPLISLNSNSKELLNDEIRVYEKIPLIDFNLLGRLEDVRRKVCEEHNISTTIVSNEVLETICAFYPTDKKSLHVDELFEEPFLNAIKEHVSEGNYNRIEVKTNSEPKRKKSYLLTLEMLNDGLSIEDIAKKRNLASSTIESHMAKCIEENLIGIEKYLPTEDKRNRISNTLSKLNSTKLKPIKELLDDESISYFDIKVSLIYFERMKNPE